jgi:hypothetical protein
MDNPHLITNGKAKHMHFMFFQHYVKQTAEEYRILFIL